MIFVGSRYEQEDVYFTLDGRSGVTRPTVTRSPNASLERLVPAAATNSVRWSEGARIDRAAMKLYGAPEKWWRILDANPDILDPMSVTVGTAVVIP